MIYIFYFFAVILVFLGYKSLRGGIEYLNYFKGELAKPASDFTPLATIFVPCRGLDQNLKENLAALLKQNYPAYEIIFIVDDKTDPAVAVIKDQLRIKSSIQNPKSKIQNQIVIAGPAENEGQKVHNLRRAVVAADERSEVFVFVDSDARPGPDWLRDLVTPLVDERIGCATGYRWFIARSAGGVAAQFRSVWNASIASALGANRENNFCWGGSLAISRTQFELNQISAAWRGTLSDDFAVTRVLKEAGLPIYFVPQCLTPTVEDCTFREFLEFSTRQMKITRVYAPHLWKASLIGSFLFSTIFFSGILLLFLTNGWRFGLTLTFLLVIFALGAAKAGLRLKAVRLVLTDYEKELGRSAIWQLFLWTLTPAIYFYNSFCALLSNEIVWRGIRYKLKSPNETIILRNDTEKE